MCGVPVHAAEQYLERLIRKGFRVAICEQVEDPAEAKKRGAKSVVRREVIRLVTPGTLTEDSLLEPSRANTLASLGRAGGEFAHGQRRHVGGNLSCRVGCRRAIWRSKSRGLHPANCWRPTAFSPMKRLRRC